MEPQTFWQRQAAGLTAAPGRALAAILVLHTLVWTALPAWLYLNLPLDLIEALVYGREWQLGYDKLPPLPWWLVEAVHRLSTTDTALYLLSQIVVVAALAIVWFAARPLVGGAGALVAVLILDGLHYFNYTAPKFNHDVIQLPLWALAGFAFQRALRGRAPVDWALLGLAIGLSLWAKYFVVMLAAPMVLFMIVDRDARRLWLTPGPYVAAAIALIVMAPHLVWLIQNDFLPFSYAEHRALPSRGALDHVWRPLQFALGQIFFLLPSLLIALPLVWPKPTAIEPPMPQPDAFDRRIVSWLAVGPVAAVLALSALTGRGTVAMWGYPLWMFIGVFIVMTARRALEPGRLLRITAIWGGVFVAMAVAFIANYDILPRFDHRYRAVFYPGEALARELTQRYRAVTGEPVVYVIGSMWDGGNVSRYAATRPRVLIDGKPDRAPWIDLNDLRSRGALVVWTDGDPDSIPIGMRNIAVDAAIQPSFTVPDRRGDGRRTVGWAILYPKPAFASR